jgi:arginine/lysine/histidine transporter system substrate-binding protein
MKKWFIIITLATTILIGCSDEKVSEKDTADVEENTTKLIMATSADYKPFEYHEITSSGDKIVGFDIDVANALAEEMNAELEIRDMDYSGLLSSLQSKRVDFVIAAMSPTDERKKNVDFSDAYFITKFAALSPPGKEYNSINNLNDLKIGVQLGSTQEAAAKAAGLDTFALNKFPELVQELKAGRIDTILVEDTVAGEYTKQNGDALSSTVIEDLPGLDVAIAFPKGSEQVESFNQAIQALVDNGTLAEIEANWFDRE